MGTPRAVMFRILTSLSSDQFLTEQELRAQFEEHLPPNQPAHEVERQFWMALRDIHQVDGLAVAVMDRGEKYVWGIALTSKITAVPLDALMLI